MSKLSLREIAQSQLDSTPVIDGQLIVCLDTGNAYRDTATAHVKIGSDLEVVSDLPLAPLAEKLYYLKPDKLYVFLGGNWTLLNDKTIDLDESIAKLPAGTATNLNDDVEIITQDTDFTQPHYYRRKLVVLWEYIKAKAQDFFAAKDHKHKKADIIDFPTSMPASDVHPWAKEATKPSYTKAEVGLGNVDNTADADKTVKRATTAGTADTANSVTWENVKDKPTTFPAADHNHDSRYYTEAEVNSKLSGKVDNTETGANGLLSKLSVWTATPTDDTYFMRQDTDGTNQFGRVKFSTIWNYIKSKADGTYQPKGSYAASSHTHDDRYYTEAEVDGKLSGKSNTGHTHDDRYYTESEIDSKLSGKADTKHIHLNGTVSGNVDWNTFITYGVYKIQNCTMSDDYHAPNPEYQFGILQVLDSENNVCEKRVLQIYWPHCTPNGNHLWYRMHNSSDINTGWTGWTPIKKKPDTAGVADYATTTGSANALSGLSSRSSQGWGVQTGTFIHGEDDSTGGSMAFRRDCPNAGQMSMVIDGRFYQNEGAYRVLDTSDEPNLNVNSANYINDVGDRRTLSFAYSKNGLAYGDYSWLAGWNGNELRAVDKNQFATAGHTHNYAGSTSPGGAANSANTLNPTVILTGGDGNTAGYRLIGQVSMNKWGNYRCVMLVNSRHQGAGLVTVTIGNNTDTITQGNAYAEIKYWGPTGSGSVISSSAYQVYISDDGKTGYLFWMYWDYSPCYVRVLGSDFTISNGTWMTGIGSGYGKCIATTQINAASTANNADTATIATTGVRDYNASSRTIRIGYSGAGLTRDNLTHIAGYTEDGTKIKDVSKDVLSSWLGLGNYLPLGGGTMSGDIAFSNCGTGTRQILFTCADNDYGRIAVGGTASNAGYMEIATADDGNEPIYVRQYSGIYASIVRSATLLDGSGNTTFPGYVTGARFYTGDWFRATGNSGFYFENHGGGWYMTDDTWIRAYNNKNIYTPGVIQCDGGFNGNLNGNANTATLIRYQGRVTAISGTDKRTAGLQLYGAYNNGYPMSYGNVICASTGTFGSEIALDCVGGGGKQGPGRMYYRNRSDWDTSEWSDWATVAYLTDKVAGANHADSADSATALNMNSAGNGNSIYGSGNDAVNGPGGGLNNVVISSWYGVSFTSPCGVGYGGKNQTAVGIDCREGIVKAARFDGNVNGNCYGYADYLYNEGVGNMRFHWSGQGGQPTWLWGSNDGSNAYVWNPSNFSVNYANSAGNGTSSFQTKVTDDGQFGAVRFNDGVQICWFTMKNTRSKTFLLPFADTNYAIAFSGGYCWLDVDSRTTTGFTTAAQWSGYENSYIAIGRWR